MTTFTKNPHVYAENSTKITGEVLLVDVTYDNAPIDPKHLEKGFSVALSTGETLDTSKYNNFVLAPVNPSTGETLDTSKYNKVVLTPVNSSLLVVFNRTVPDSTVLVNVYIKAKTPASLVSSDNIQLNDSYHSTRFSGSVNLSLYYGKVEDLPKEVWTNSSKLFRTVWQYTFR